MRWWPRPGRSRVSGAADRSWRPKWGMDEDGRAARCRGGRWTPPAGVTTPTVNIVAPPAVTRGVDGAEIELVYVTAGGVASHARYLAGAWTTPVVITTSTGLTRVAVAGAP